MISVPEMQFSYIFWNATGAGVEKVIAPIKNADIARLMPLARRFVGKTSAAHTTAGASTHCDRFQHFSLEWPATLTWKNAMNKKMNRTHAAFPALWSVPRYFHWSSASARRMHASDANPITSTVS